MAEGRVDYQPNWSFGTQDTRFYEHEELKDSTVILSLNLCGESYIQVASGPAS